jgi:hypothetical protein
VTAVLSIRNYPRKRHAKAVNSNGSFKGGVRSSENGKPNEILNSAAG